uniref:NADH dehydrogenase subunit 2 n=1 Tax=Dipterosiphonia australica TaxID=2007208 RepID=UPI0022FD3CF9|nr:NADH dehydrogenase subunit 2 [Dipterosiphonia australica]WAX04239.1 NADH dehydrogenase subunit 2 [Dipterosiphonia australica]
MTLNIFFINLYPLISEFFLLLLSCFCLLFGSMLSTSNFKKFPLLNRAIYFFILQGLLFSFILLVCASPIFIIFWNKLLICDSISFYSKFIIIFFAICWVLIFSHITILNFEFWILILLNIVALAFLLHAYDLLSIYLSIEFLSLIFYILTSINRISEFSTESGLKYFILGAFASALLLFGFSLLYSFTGLTNLQDFSVFFTDYSWNYSTNLNFGLLLSIIFILSAFLFKLGAAPFHFWLPDVYEGAPNSITAWFALLPKLVFLILIIRFIFFAFNNFMMHELYIYLVFSTFLSGLVGTAGAFLQTKWKRFIAFSSISHLSFFLLILCSFKTDYLIYLFTYLLIYLLMTCTFFSFFSFITIFKFPNNFNPRFFYSLKFLSLINPPLAGFFSIVLFSFAGIPPLAGFFSKFFVIYSAISSHFFFLVLALLLLNCISCFYYIRLIRKNYFNQIEFSYLPVIYSTKQNNNSFILSSLSVFLILLIFDFDFIFLFANLLQNAFLS